MMLENVEIIDTIQFWSNNLEKWLKFQLNYRFMNLFFIISKLVSSYYNKQTYKAFIFIYILLLITASYHKLLLNSL